MTSRYFTYAKRGFPYSSSEDALRAAVAVGEREGLRGVEFGALYHLQLLMKLRNEWSEFATLIARIAEISDSRYTTQVAIEDYERYLRVIQSTREANPSPAIRSLVGPLLR